MSHTIAYFDIYCVNETPTRNYGSLNRHRNDCTIPLTLIRTSEVKTLICITVPIYSYNQSDYNYVQSYSICKNYPSQLQDAVKIYLQVCQRTFGWSQKVEEDIIFKRFANANISDLREIALDNGRHIQTAFKKAPITEMTLKSIKHFPLCVPHLFEFIQANLNGKFKFVKWANKNRILPSDSLCRKFQKKNVVEFVRKSIYV